MDIIQRTMLLFDRLVQRIKSIGNMLTYNYLPETSAEKSSPGLFWIFGW